MASGGAQGRSANQERERQSDETRPRRVSESFVSWLWQRQLLARELWTPESQRIQVVYPGWRCGSSGPDFHGALFAIDGQLVRGDVELHVRARDWHLHGHSTDPAYDSTVLHVVFEATQSLPTVRSDGQVVPTVALVGALREPLDVLLARWRSEPGAGPPLAHCLEPGEAGPLLDEAGLARFRGKIDRFEGDIAAVAPTQALWTGLLESLGYSANVAPMRRLAEQVPIVQASSVLALEGIESLEALLLGTSGLLPSQRGRLPLDEIAVDRERRWGSRGGRQGSGNTWSWVGLRPANEPVRRVVCAATLVGRLAGDLPDKTLDALRSQPSRGVARTLRAQLECVGEQYWREHFDFGRPLSRPTALLGAGRADDAVVNVLLPWAAALGRATDDETLVNAAEAAYLVHPRLPTNQIVRHMTEQIFGSGRQLDVTNACRQQGLIHLFRNWCDSRLCSGCPAGRQHQGSDFFPISSRSRGTSELAGARPGA